jgi:flagellar capping protein FliD
MQAFQMEQWGKGIPILLIMLEKQDSVIERQDTTIGILKSVKEDTAAIRTDTKEIAAKLWEKYEELSKEIAQMKITLSKIEAKVFS